MPRAEIKIQVVPLAVAQKVLAEELGRKRPASRVKISKLNVAKSGQT